MNYFVFRINYEDAFYPVLRDEIMIHGRLRQGWGADGMTLLQPKETFIDAWKQVWGDENATETYMSGKWNMLQIIREMNEGDLIVIPKMSADDQNHWSYFTIAERTADPYYFQPVDNDFGHIVPVRPIVSFSYNHNDKSRIVSAKFKAYQRPINRVYSSEFCDAVDALVNEFHNNPDSCQSVDRTSLAALAMSALNGKNAYLEQLVSQINHWQPSHLEKIIEELFVKNGYIKRGNNRYDRKGGDVDLVFEAFVPNTFMADIFSFSNNAHMPEIRIQAKNKTGIDDGDIEGVEQLIKMEGHEAAINILINTTREFSERAKSLAAEKGIILINGMEFASLLVKYGLDVL